MQIFNIINFNEYNLNHSHKFNLRCFYYKFKKILYFYFILIVVLYILQKSLKLFNFCAIQETRDTEISEIANLRNLRDCLMIPYYFEDPYVMENAENPFRD